MLLNIYVVILICLFLVTFGTAWLYAYTYNKFYGFVSKACALTLAILCILGMLVGCTITF